MGNPTEAKKPPYTVEEVAELFNTTARTIRRWLNEGKIFDRSKVFRVPGGYRFPRDEVARAMKDRTLKD